MHRPVLCLLPSLVLVACGGSDDASPGASPDAAESPDTAIVAPDAATGDAAPSANDAAPPVDPYAAWPAPEAVFPAVFSPDPDAPDYAHVRWETEDWNVGDSPQSGLYLRKLSLHYQTAPPEVVEHFRASQGDIPPL